MQPRLKHKNIRTGKEGTINKHLDSRGMEHPVKTLDASRRGLKHWKIPIHPFQDSQDQGRGGRWESLDGISEWEISLIIHYFCTVEATKTRLARLSSPYE